MSTSNLSFIRMLVVSFVLIFAGFFTIIVTGILMSRSFLPAFGLTGLHSFTLKILHVQATQITIYRIIAHLLLNLRWMLALLKRLFKKPTGKKSLRPGHIYG